MGNEILEATVYDQPFPLMVIDNFYNDDELKLIWEELDFYTKPGKFLDAKDYGGLENYTNAKALLLDEIYESHREISNILTVNRKLFTSGVLNKFAELHDCCDFAADSNWDITKVRYYHNGEYYDPHKDAPYHFLGFSYFYKEPKKFTGGDLIFPKYEFKVPCNNNSMVIFPGWVEHGVRKVTIEDSDYFDGYGRYAITHFFGSKAREISKDLDNSPESL